MNILFFYFVLAPRMVFLKPRESILDLRNILASKQEVKFTREYRRLRKSHMPFWYCVYTSLRSCNLLVVNENFGPESKPLHDNWDIPFQFSPGASAPTLAQGAHVRAYYHVHYYHHEVMWIACVCARCEKYVPHVPRSKHLVEHLCGTQFIPQLCYIAPDIGTNVPMFHQKQNLRKTDRRPLLFVIDILLTKKYWNTWNISQLSSNQAPFACSTRPILRGTLWNTWNIQQRPAGAVRCRFYVSIINLGDKNEYMVQLW